ncbi:MAG TPA: DNA polymerase III subunit delta' [Vicinamibacterales bacterium]|nr:DNA polymerase III subunit delta' [Vicinamibacterales bacterium]
MSLRTIAGHRHLLERLARAIAAGTLPPSVIFSGPEGVGKRTAAQAIAQALNCERPVEWPSASAGEPGRDACGECAACRRIARGVHADLLIVAPGESGAIKLDQVREAVERSAYRPFEGRRRVVIVDGADALIAEAQNALLKTLEEPPPASVFVLVTARPDLLLPTVRSRCQRLRFGPLTAPEIAAVLMRDHGFAAADAHAAAAAADGSIGRALDRDVEHALAARDAAARLLTSAASGADPRRRLDAARTLSAGAAERDALADRLRALSSLLRDLGALHAHASDDVLANIDLKPVLQSAARTFDADRIDGAFAAVDRALAALDRNASPKIVADWIALNI